jgi:hypothetical protein
MKNHYSCRLLLLAAGPLFCQCSKTPADAVAPQVDYDQKSITLVQGVAPAVPGEWVLRRLYVKAQPYNTGQKELKLARDTVFQDFATMSIRAVPSKRPTPDLRYASFEATLRFRTKTYPVRFELSASPDGLVNEQGPQAVFMMDYNYSTIGSRPTEPEEQFLEYLGFMRDNFSLHATPGQPNMVWRGLSRGVDRIELQKR